MSVLRRCSLPALFATLLMIGPATAAAETAAETVYKIPLRTISSEPAPADGHEPHSHSHSHPGERPPPAGEESPGATPEREVEPQPEARSPHPEEPHAISPAVAVTEPVASHGESPSPTKGAAPKKSGGGTSPVVALLIAISVLAVISIGVARHSLRR